MNIYCKNLKSLEGCPKEVGGSFYCDDCGEVICNDEGIEFDIESFNKELDKENNKNSKEKKKKFFKKKNK